MIGGFRGKNQAKSALASSVSLKNVYAETILSTIHSPAAWLFFALIVIATCYLALTGHAIDLLVCLEPLFFLFLTFLFIIPLTAGAPLAPWEEPPSYLSHKLWWQCIIIIMIFVLLLIFANQLSDLLGFPALLQIFSFLKLVFPLGIALLLGTRWRERGLAGGIAVGGVP